MSIPRKVRFTFSSLLACGFLGLVFVSLATQRSYGPANKEPFRKLTQQNDLTKEKPGLTKEKVKSRFPAVDYDAEEPADPVERTKRRNKGKRFDQLGGVRKEPTRLSAALLNHWDLDLPPLPVRQSNAVVVAKTLRRAAFLSNDKGAVYTELSVKVDEVLKTDDDSVGKGSLIDINRLGGIVRYRTGEESLFMIVGQNMPEVGKRYVFFLRTLHDSKDFQLITGYELGPSGVSALDTPGQFQQFNGIDEPTFLDKLRRAVGEINPSGR